MDTSTTQSRLERYLAALPLQDVRATVERSDNGLMAVVVSPSFRGKGEAKRQELVWTHLLALLSPGDLETIEFVFALTPDEDVAVRMDGPDRLEKARG